MNIGIVTTSYPRFPGDGAGIFIFNLVEALRELGYTVKVVAPEVVAEKSPEPLKGVYRVRFCPRFAGQVAYGLGIVENIKKNPLLLFGVPGFIDSIARTVDRQLGDCDVIDACFTAAGIAATRVRRPYQPLVYTGHGTDIHLLDRSRLYRRYFSNILSKFDAVTVVSTYLANKLIEYRCHSDAVVIPNGVPKESFDYVSRWHDEPTAIYASRFIGIKRPLLLVRAWAKVVQGMPGAKLIMFGDGPLLLKAKKIAKSLGLAKSINFKGEVSTKQVWTEMGRGWLTVLPSTLEGFPPLLLESLAAGTPFLSSPAGAASEIADRTGGGFIVPTILDPQKFGEAIIFALSNKKILEEMGKRGRKRVAELYSWNTIAKEKVKLYTRTVKKINERYASS